jgi:hypothetical protein
MNTVGGCLSLIYQVECAYDLYNFLVIRSYHYYCTLISKIAQSCYFLRYFFKPKLSRFSGGNSPIRSDCDEIQRWYSDITVWGATWPSDEGGALIHLCSIILTVTQSNIKLCSIILTGHSLSSIGSRCILTIRRIVDFDPDQHFWFLESIFSMNCF